jgi:23S rRNA (guanosine2251-2'-O)-methyltransferase
MDILYGLHPVEEALRAGLRRFDHVCIAKERHDARLQQVIEACRAAGVRLRFEPRESLTRLAQTSAHQGVIAVVREKSVLDLEDLLEPLATPRLLLALDGVEDPQNLGALLRTADGAGVDGVVLTERRSAPLSPVATKASAGASEHVRIARVRALEQMKAANIWSVGLDERGDRYYDEFDFTGNCVLVLGREGAGLHELVKKTCDHLLKIPMAGGVSSLNVSAAGAVVLYEAARQRRKARKGAAASPTEKFAQRKQKGLGS